MPQTSLPVDVDAMEQEVKARHRRAHRLLDELEDVHNRMDQLGGRHG